MAGECFYFFLTPFQSDLLFVLLLCKRLERLYEKHGLPNDLFVETMKDISYKVKECKLVKGMVGTFVATWFSGFFELNRFTFGRLQFEMVPFGVDYHKISAKTPSINVHIPRMETPLDSKSVQKSFEMANAFYRKTLGDKLIYRCFSWLLSPRNGDFLKEDSNILSFMNRWTIIKTEYFADYKELWRLFGCEYVSADALPADSSLRRAYIGLVKAEEKIGLSFGYFVKEF